jgi:hypothetical protein
MTIEQLEREILNLPPLDFRRLADWIAARDQERWDPQREEDVAAGKLDALADEALAEHRAGRTRPL